MNREKNADKTTRIVRIISLVLSSGLICWAVYGGDLIGGGLGFGWSQTAVLISGIALALTCLYKTDWASGLLAIFISAGLTLSLAELILRPILSPRYFGVFELDAYYLYKLVPNLSREYNRQPIKEKGYVTYHINSQGFRGEEFVQDGEHSRIVVYGDSFIHAEFSALEDTFTEQLEDKLSQCLEKNVEVINAGVAGYGPGQIVSRMEKELSWLQPDLVVAGIFVGNDFGELIRSKLHRLDHNWYLQKNEFVISEHIEKKMAPTRGELLLKKYHVTLSVASDRMTRNWMVKSNQDALG